MKISRSMIWLLGCFFGLASLQGCALLGGGDQQEQLGELEQLDQDDEQNDDDDQEGDEENEENEANEQNEEGNNSLANLANNDAGMMGAEGMGIPDNMQDDAMNNAANNMAIPTEANMAGMEDLNSMMNQGANNAAADAMMPSNLAAEAPPMENMSAGQMDPGPMAAPAAMPAPGDARVYYIITNGTELKDGPGGNTVQSLEQGEPVLAKIEGEWANVINRGYVKISQVSTTPVGREQKTLAWQ